MRKNIDDRFHIVKDGELYTIESLIRDKVDDEFLLGIYEQMKAGKKNLETNLENIPKQIEALQTQRVSVIPQQIKSLEKKIDKLNPVIAEIKIKQEKEAAAKKASDEQSKPAEVKEAA
jgi:tmRNA-binding protein